MRLIHVSWLATAVCGCALHAGDCPADTEVAVSDSDPGAGLSAEEAVGAVDGLSWSVAWEDPVVTEDGPTALAFEAQRTADPAKLFSWSGSCSAPRTVLSVPVVLSVEGASLSLEGPHVLEVTDGVVNFFSTAEEELSVADLPGTIEAMYDDAESYNANEVPGSATTRFATVRGGLETAQLHFGVRWDGSASAGTSRVTDGTLVAEIP